MDKNIETSSKIEEQLATADTLTATANAANTTKTETQVVVPIKSFPLELQQDQKRRSSSRSIKRKRFDDEIVEYSLAAQNRGGSSSSDQNRVGRPRTTSQTVVATTTAPITTVTTSTTALVTALPPPTSSLPSITTSAGVSSISQSPTSLQNTLTVTPTACSATHTSPTLNTEEEVTTTNIANTSTSKSNTSGRLSASLPQKQLSTTSLNTIPMQNSGAQSVSSAFAGERRRIPRGNNKRSRKSGRPSNQVATKDLGRWKAIDDLALIIGVQQTNDLRMVHRGVKFSCRFTLQELQARWMSLLYEPAISRLAFAGIRNLHPEIIESVQRKAIFSTQEEELLAAIKSTDNPKLEQFQELLDNNASIFFQSRTAKSLQNHWNSMKQYQLLNDQVVKPLPVSGQPMSFSDAEDLILDAELNEQRDETLEIELKLNDRQQKREIRILENELTRWNVLVDSITGMGVSPEFDSQTLAIIRGRLVRYLMRSKEITFGRDSKDCVVDVDLTLEGPSTKISRRQGTIKLRSNGDFFICNEGKRPIFINGIPLTVGNRTRLANNCVLEICGLRFVFLVNYELINAIRHESAKTTTPLN